MCSFLHHFLASEHQVNHLTSDFVAQMHPEGRSWLLRAPVHLQVHHGDGPQPPTRLPARSRTPCAFNESGANTEQAATARSPAQCSRYKCIFAEKSTSYVPCNSVYCSTSRAPLTHENSDNKSTAPTIGCNFRFVSLF